MSRGLAGRGHSRIGKAAEAMALLDLSSMAAGGAIGAVIGLGFDMIFPTRSMGAAVGLLIGMAVGAALAGVRVWNPP
jgi:F0F1-type ATP synthase assembly protein I